MKLKKLIPLKFRRFVRDQIESLKRKFPPAMRGWPELGLEPSQIYPIGNNIRNSLQIALKKQFDGLIIKSTTNTASLGTCFAEEFSTYIKNSNGKYLYKEANRFNSSANWGRIYTITNLHQIIEYSLQPDYPIIVESCSRGFFDPLRERSVGYYCSFKEASDNISSHRKASEMVFRDAEVLVITLGQNEAWIDSQNNKVWGSNPPTDLWKSQPKRFLPIEFSYLDNFNRLEASLLQLLSINENLKIIITVSPVAAFATFISENVVTQSFAGKCLLRSVVHDIIRKFPKKVFYFPSFEMVFCDNPYKFRSDNMHVKFKTVDEIFSVFSRATNNSA
jgi:hypothetical protein